MNSIFTYLISTIKLVVIIFALLFVAFVVIAKIKIMASKQRRLILNIVDIENKNICQIKI
jgi:hypothetical protein